MKGLNIYDQDPEKEEKLRILVNSEYQRIGFITRSAEGCKLNYLKIRKYQFKKTMIF